MNWLDIILILVLSFFAFLGWKKGLIRAVLILAGLILGVFIAGRFYVPLGDGLPISNATTARIVAFLIIFIAVLAVAIVVAFLLRKTIAAIKLGCADTVLGALFGFVVGAVICGVLLALFAHFFNVETTIGQSWIASIVLDRVPALLAILPDEFDTVRAWFQ
jgi:membrane protein required for colicin V production